MVVGGGCGLDAGGTAAVRSSHLGLRKGWRLEWRLAAAVDAGSKVLGLGLEIGRT